MSKDELISACLQSLSQGLDFMPLVLGKGKKIYGYKIRALGQHCEILCENANGHIVVRASAKKTLKWIKKMELKEQAE